MEQIEKQNITTREIQIETFSIENNQVDEEAAKKEILNYLLDEESEFEV